MRVTITLQDDEKNALLVLAEQEKRDPRRQAALIIRRDLERRGLLPEQPDRAEVQHDHAAQ